MIMWRTIGGVVVGLAVYWLIGYSKEPSFGGLGDPVSGRLAASGWVIGYLVTIAGVLLGAGFRRVLRLQTQGQTEVDLVQVSRDTIRSTDLWLGLLGSPLLFALIVKTLGGLDFAGLVAVGLQNGFFCATLVTEMVSKGGKAEAPKQEPNPP